MSDIVQYLTRLQSMHPQLADALLGLIKSTAILLMAAGAAGLVRTAGGRNWAWRCALATLLGLMAWQVLPSEWGARWMTWQMDVTPLTAVSAASSDISAAAAGIGATPESLANQGGGFALPGRWETRIIFLWKWTAVLLIALHIARSLGGGWWLRRNSRAADENNQGVEVRLSTLIETPLLAGWFRPVIYLPIGATEWTAMKKQSVMLHEMAHWNRRDLCWQDVGTVAACLWWWNPLSWIALKRLKAEAEQAADDVVVVKQGKAEEYARMLVEMASVSPNTPSGGVPILGQSPLHQRIRRILTPDLQREKIGRWSGGMLGMLGAFLILCVGADVVLGERNVKNNRGEVILFQASDPEKNVLTQGEFLKAGAKLKGWTGNLASVTFPESGVARLAPGTKVETTLPRHPKWEWLTVSARTRPGPGPKDKQEGGLIFTQLDSAGKAVGAPVRITEGARGDYDNWLNRIRSLHLESDTKSLRIEIEVPAGSSPMDCSEVLVMPARLEDELDHDLTKRFFEVVRANDIPAAKEMLVATPGLVEARNGSADNGTPLTVCAWNELPEMAQLLIEHGAKLETLDSNWKSTPLTWCGWWGSPKTAAVLLKAGANPKFKSIYGVSPTSSAKAGKGNNRASKSTPQTYDETIALLEAAAKK